mmetsp:Transcript_26605/g.25468  ORF Transcript_26605/g.25468 Transcript_26605/m.25468 type:complete len:203 (-) Transcript_26605:493-1101(-)
MQRVTDPLRKVCRNFPTQLQKNRPMLKIAGLGVALLGARYVYKALQDKNSPISTGLSSAMRSDDSPSEQHYQDTPKLLRSSKTSSAIIEAHNELHIRVDQLENRIAGLETMYKRENVQGKSLLIDTKEATMATETREALTSSSIMVKCQICNCNEISHVIVPCGHTTCSACSESLHGSDCPFCGVAIDQKVRFHIDNKEAKE